MEARTVLGIALGALGLAGLLLLGRARGCGAPAPAAPPVPASAPPPAPAPERRALPTGPPAPAADDADRWVRLNDEATELLAAGELDAARARLELCVAAAPDQEVFRANLAEALARTARAEQAAGAPAAALASLARARALAPGRADLARLAARWETERALEEEHWSEGSDLFVLSYDAERDELLQRSQEVLDHLERSYERLRSWFAADPVRGLGRDPIRVVLYREEEFDRLTGLGDWAGGAFDGVVRASVPALGGPGAEADARWRRILSHELVHAFVHALGGEGVPGWLNEGLAQLLEEPPPDLEAARRQLGTRAFPLERLRAGLAGWQDPEEIRRAYAQGLLFVEHLRAGYGAEALRRMVLAPATGASVADAFEAWASVPLAFAFDTFTAGLGGG